MPPRPPRATLCPYTTLFRSQHDREVKFVEAVLTNDVVAVRQRPVVAAEVTAAVAHEVDTEADRERVVDLRNEPSSEEHTSELQSLAYLVCRHLPDKKNENNT